MWGSSDFTRLEPHLGHRRGTLYSYLGTFDIALVPAQWKATTTMPTCNSSRPRPLCSRTSKMRCQKHFGDPQRQTPLVAAYIRRSDNATWTIFSSWYDTMPKRSIIIPHSWLATDRAFPRRTATLGLKIEAYRATNCGSLLTISTTA